MFSRFPVVVAVRVPWCRAISVYSAPMVHQDQILRNVFERLRRMTRWLTTNAKATPSAIAIKRAPPTARCGTGRSAYGWCHFTTSIFSGDTGAMAGSGFRRRVRSFAGAAICCGRESLTVRSQGASGESHSACPTSESHAVRARLDDRNRARAWRLWIRRGPRIPRVPSWRCLHARRIRIYRDGVMRPAYDSC